MLGMAEVPTRKMQLPVHVHVGTWHAQVVLAMYCRIGYSLHAPSLRMYVHTAIAIAPCLVQGLTAWS